MSELTVHVRIEGRVQGVWYRGWTVRTAEDIGLAGWVRNRRDGSVEAIFKGTQTQIDQMIEQCRFGPSSAKVDQIRVNPSAEDVLPGFEQRPTA